ncbi:MAG TPA: hypothetical protein VFS53_00935 [Gemmatimonadota bacterium]|jgi:hypothetical protein|nr:hypothetical protein [Gemmatimonadota bacterium]
MSRSRFAVLALAAMACARTLPPPATEGSTAVRLRGLDFSADLEVAPSPIRLAGEVRVTNRGAMPETLVFADGCPVRLRVYEIQGARVAPVWEGPRECAAEPVAVAIAPGESAMLPIPPTSAGEILGADLPAAAYRVTLWLALAPDERVIEIEAGEVDLTPSS